jgi:hypothetical protein
VIEAMDWSKKTQGVEVITLPPAEKAKWDARLEPIVAKWTKDMTAKGLPAAQIITDIKMMAKKYH